MKDKITAEFVRNFRFDLQQFADEPQKPNGGQGAGDPSTGSGNGGTPPAPTVPPKNDPPPADPNAIAAQARTDFLKALGFGSEAELKAALETKTKKQGDPTPDDIKARMEALEKQNAEMKAENRSVKIANEVARTISNLKVTLHSPDDFGEALKRFISADKDGNIIVTDGAGNIRYNNQGQRLTVAELAEETLKAKAYFVKSGVNGGPGVPPTGGERGYAGDADEIKTLLSKPVLTMEEAAKIKEYYDKKHN